MFWRRKRAPTVHTVAALEDNAYVREMSARAFEVAIKGLQEQAETAKVIPWESPGYRDSWQRALEDSATSITG